MLLNYFIMIEQTRNRTSSLKEMLFDYGEAAKRLDLKGMYEAAQGVVEGIRNELQEGVRLHDAQEKGRYYEGALATLRVRAKGLLSVPEFSEIFNRDVAVTPCIVTPEQAVDRSSSPSIA